MFVITNSFYRNKYHFLITCRHFPIKLTSNSKNDLLFLPEKVYKDKKHIIVKQIPFLATLIIYLNNTKYNNMENPFLRNAY